MDGKNAARLRGAYRSCLTSGIALVVVGLLFIALVVYEETQYRQKMGSMYAYIKNKPSFLEPNLPMFCLCFGMALLMFVLALIYRRKMLKALDEEQVVYDKIRGVAATPLSASGFLAHRDTLRQSDFTGVYILHNKSKDMYYVGQSVKVIDRVGQHFTGHGNGDVYADFKYGDEFTVSTVSLVDSGYGSLNDLERDTIAAHDAYNNGYNRTSGNSR